MSSGLTFRAFVQPLKWIDGTPSSSTSSHIAGGCSIRRSTRRPTADVRYNDRLRSSKKNWKSADLCLRGALRARWTTRPAGTQESTSSRTTRGQAADDLSLAKKIVKANRCSSTGSNVEGEHHRAPRRRGLYRSAARAGRRSGSTARRIGCSASTRSTATAIGICSKRSRRTRRGRTRRSGSRPTPRSTTGPACRCSTCCSGQARAATRGCCSAGTRADFTTDPAFADADARAAGEPVAWRRGATTGYLEQQQRRLPAHKYRRLHLNLPGLPEGSAFQPEPDHGCDRARRDDCAAGAAACTTRAFVDMSGGSNDDAMLAIAHKRCGRRARSSTASMNQGPPPPFDPRAAVERFVARTARVRRQPRDR